jgi:hypothetical protein
MSIDRVPKVPFAQIANEALRDKRLSFKARGILAMVLSHSGEWNAGRDFIVSQSDHDGQKSVQAGLNELTELGYRKVVKKQKDDGTWESWVEWTHSGTGCDLTDRSVIQPSVPVTAIRTPSKNTNNNNSSTYRCTYCRMRVTEGKRHNCSAMNMSF